MDHNWRRSLPSWPPPAQRPRSAWVRSYSTTSPSGRAGQGAATVELLTDSRFEFGIGAGWNASDYTKTGIPFEAPRERVNRLEEALAIITRFFAGTPVTFDGTYYRISDLDAQPEAKPKVLVGANGRRMLRLAARYADILNFPDRPPMGISMGGNRGLGISFADQMAIVKEAAGERYTDLELSVLSIPRVTDQPKETYDKLAQQMQTTAQIV